MPKAISDKIQLGETLNAARDYGDISLINDEGTLENLLSKVDKAQSFIEKGKADGHLLRYYPNILPITRQLQIAGELPRKAYASVTYSDEKQLEFTLDLRVNTCTNYSIMEVCVPIKFTKKTNKAQAIDDEMIPVNNFFGHWFTDLDIRRYPNDMLILPINNSVSIANYSNAQMKYLPTQSVKKLAKTMLYSNKAVYLDDNNDRTSHNSATTAERTDLNLNERIKLFKDYIFQKNVYRIPLTLLYDLGK